MMARITDEMREVMAKAGAWALATATKDGVPNVVPIRFARAFAEDRLVLMDLFMQKTKQNIKENPRVAVSVWDFESLKGYQFKGEARFMYSGKGFIVGLGMVKDALPKVFPKGALIVKVESIYETTFGPDAGKEIGP
ncbi:MAG: pyridoxamine 5'-phosphate oxidase family protein [Chloroflexota bacterium]